LLSKEREALKTQTNFKPKLHLHTNFELNEVCAPSTTRNKVEKLDLNYIKDFNDEDKLENVKTRIKPYVYQKEEINISQLHKQEIEYLRGLAESSSQIPKDKMHLFNFLILGGDPIECGEQILKGMNNAHYSTTLNTNSKKSLLENSSTLPKYYFMNTHILFSMNLH